MNCPNCGAVTSESICPVCGAAIGGGSGFKLAGSEFPQQSAAYDAQTDMASQDMSDAQFDGASQNMGSTPFSMGSQQSGMASPFGTGSQQSGMVSPFGATPDPGMAYSTEPQQNGYAGDSYGAGGFDMGDQPYQATYVPSKKSGMGALIGIVAAIIVVVLVAIVLISNMGLFENGAKKSEAVIDKFFTGIEEADMDKVLETVDNDCVGENDAETLSESFELLTSMGVEYSIDYTINSTEKANRATIKNMCDEIYDGKSSGVKKAYICDVDYTMSMTYLGESQSETDSMSLICYKKGGKWYIGGTVEDTE